MRELELQGLDFACQNKGFQGFQTLLGGSGRAWESHLEAMPWVQHSIRPGLASSDLSFWQIFGSDEVHMCAWRVDVHICRMSTLWIKIVYILRALFQVFQRDWSTTMLTWEYVLYFAFMYLSFIFGCAGYSWLCALFSSCSERGPLFVVVCRLLTAVASLVAGRGL